MTAWASVGSRTVATALQGLTLRPQERPRVWLAPAQWQWFWLRDGRVCFLEQTDDAWHVIVGRSTVFVAATRAQAMVVVDELCGEYAAPRP